VTGLLVLAGITLPYAVAALSSPPGQIYLGLAAWAPDQLSYLMWMRQVAGGGPCYNLMTAQPHPPLTPPLIWVMLGWLVRVSGLSPIAAYHVGRAALAGLYLSVLWQALRIWVPRPAARAVAFVAIGTGSGLGWVARLLDWPSTTPDQWMPELWSFSSLLYYPHFAASLLLVALGWWGLGKMERPVRGWGWGAVGLAAAAAGEAAIHPYTYLPLLGAGLAYTARWVRRKGGWGWRWGAGWGALLAGLPILATHALATAHHPMLRAWALQMQMPSPSPAAYLVGLGWAGLAALGVAVWLAAQALSVRGSGPQSAAYSLGLGGMAAGALRCAALWLGVAFALAYAYPYVPFARRCVEGAHLFVVVLGLPVLLAAVEPVRQRWGLAAAAGTVGALLCPTSLVLARDAAGWKAVRVPAQMAQMWRYCREHLPADAAIFCRAAEGMYVPAFTGRRVYVGHFHLTPDYKRRAQVAEWFFAPQASNGYRAAVLRGSGCQYVLAGPGSAAVRQALAQLLGPPVFAAGPYGLYAIPASLRR
jgi:hypothetical protein